MADDSSHFKPEGEQVDHPQSHLKIKGGPHKIEGVQKSAQDARDARNVQEPGAEGEDRPEEEGQDPHEMHPGPSMRLRGGPAKIAAVQKSAHDAQVKRELFAREEEKSVNAN